MRAAMNRKVSSPENALLGYLNEFRQTWPRDPHFLSFPIGGRLLRFGLTDGEFMATSHLHGRAASLLNPPGMEFRPLGASFQRRRVKARLPCASRNRRAASELELSSRVEAHRGQEGLTVLRSLGISLLSSFLVSVSAPESNT